MSQRLSRSERKAQTREQLIEAAFRCFESEGFAATTLEQIAAEAGVTTGAVYSNFKSKEALFLELLDRIEAQPVDVSMLGNAARPLADRFRDFGQTNARSVELPPTTMATWYEVRAFALRSEPARRASHDTVLAEMEAWGERIDRLASQMGAHPALSGRTIAIISQSLLDGLRGMRSFLPDEVTPEVYGEATRLLAHLFDEQAADHVSSEAQQD